MHRLEFKLDPGQRGHAEIIHVGTTVASRPVTNGYQCFNFFTLIQGFHSRKSLFDTNAISCDRSGSLERSYEET